MTVFWGLIQQFTLKSAAHHHIRDFVHRGAMGNQPALIRPQNVFHGEPPKSLDVAPSTCVNAGDEVARIVQHIHTRQRVAASQTVDLYFANRGAVGK